MAQFSLNAIADRIDGELLGDPSLSIHDIRTAEEAGEGHICVLMGQGALAKADQCAASAIIVPLEGEVLGRNLIRVREPRRSLISLLHLFYPRSAPEAGIDPLAVVSPKAKIDPEAFIGAGTHVDAGATIRAGAIVHPSVSVGRDADVGEGSEIFPNVVIYPGTRIGSRVRVHSGTVLGSDGFGYMRDEQGEYQKIPQVGGLEIGDEVEIGANCSIDRATLGITRIAAGTKIDNLVQIGHNSDIGKNCCIIAQVGISGSVTIGESCVLAGQAGIRDHVKLESGAIVGAQAGVPHDLGPGEWLGSPAIPASQARRAYLMLGHLPDLRHQIRDLRKRCAELEERLGVMSRE